VGVGDPAGDGDAKAAGDGDAEAAGDGDAEAGDASAARAASWASKTVAAKIPSATNGRRITPAYLLSNVKR
jgi:hypothetical protein